MSSRIYAPLLALSLTASLSLPLGALASPSAGVPRPEVADASGAVYTATNGVSLNEVVAYRRAADGSLAYIGTFPTQGRGSGGAIDPLQSQHSLLLSDDHTLLFAVNSGSGDVSVFAVQKGGRLRFLDKAPSGGGFPNSLAVHGDLLYVLNAGGAGSVSGFHVRRNGRLETIPGSTHLLSAASAGGASIDFSPDGSTLAATERLTNLIDTFPIGPDGTVGAPVLNRSNGATPFSLTYTPQGALVVAEAAGNPAGGSALSSYAPQTGGGLSVITGSVPTTFAAACWVVASSDGNYAYSANAGSSAISVVGIGDDGTLGVLGSAGTGAGSVPLDLALSGNGRYLYALTAGAGTITEFRVGAGGGLIGLGTVASLPPASGQNGLAAY